MALAKPPSFLTSSDTVRFAQHRVKSHKITHMYFIYNKHTAIAAKRDQMWGHRRAKNLLQSNLASSSTFSSDFTPASLDVCATWQDTKILLELIFTPHTVPTPRHNLYKRECGFLDRSGGNGCCLLAWHNFCLSTFTVSFTNLRVAESGLLHNRSAAYLQ